MTWTKAVPVLAVSIVFDAVRLVFANFWFFGPALAGTGAAAWVSSMLGGGVVGGVVGVGAGAVTTYYAAAASGAFQMIGTVIAMAIGFMGWLTIGLWLVVGNPEIFKVSASNKLWMLLGLGVAETPILSSFVPALTGSVVRAYRVQIKHDKAVLKRWQAKQARIEKENRTQFSLQVAFQKNQLMQARQEAHTNALDADGADVIPEDVRQAA